MSDTVELKEKKQTVGRPEPEFRFDIFTVIFIIIGFVTSWVNMLIIFNLMTVAAYLSIIFTVMIPGIAISVRNRYWSYGYVFGFCIAGIPFYFLVDIFIGGYTFAVSLFLFIIMWLVFWKTWRALGAIKNIAE
ncbi:MAG: hypothetical protein ACTSQJ_16945 [Promethearchaeota archaeon]